MACDEQGQLYFAFAKPPDPSAPDEVVEIGPPRYLSYGDIVTTSFRLYWEAVQSRPTVMAYQALNLFSLALNNSLLGVVSEHISNYADSAMMTPYLLLVHSGLAGLLPSLVGFALLQRQVNDIRTEKFHEHSRDEIVARQLKLHRRSVAFIALSMASLAVCLSISTGAVSGLPFLGAGFILSYLAFHSFDVIALHQSSQIGQEALLHHFKDNERKGKEMHINLFWHIEYTVSLIGSALMFVLGRAAEQLLLSKLEHPYAVIMGLVLFATLGIGVVHALFERRIIKAMQEMDDYLITDHPDSV